VLIFIYHKKTAEVKGKGERSSIYWNYRRRELQPQH